MPSIFPLKVEPDVETTLTSRESFKVMGAEIVNKKSPRLFKWLTAAFPVATSKIKLPPLGSIVVFPSISTLIVPTVIGTFKLRVGFVAAAKFVMSAVASVAFGNGAGFVVQFALSFQFAGEPGAIHSAEKSVLDKRQKRKAALKVNEIVNFLNLHTTFIQFLMSI